MRREAQSARVILPAMFKPFFCMSRKLKMKGIFLALCIIVLLSAAAFAQTIENASHSTIGYISASGTIENSSHSTVGYINSNGSVENGSRTTIGYITSNGTVENASHSTIGYISDS